MTVSLGSSGPGAEVREDQAAGLSSEPNRTTSYTEPRDTRRLARISLRPDS